MIVQRFMHWVSTASAADRAHGAGALAQAFLFSDMAEAERDDAETALTALLDDPSPNVRKAIADAFAGSTAAPHALVLSLANDQSDVSATVLRHSPLLTDAELIDCAAIGDAFAQVSIALRPVVSAAVSAALAEVGRREALIALAINAGADLPAFAARRMVARFGDDADVREGLLSRHDLAQAVRSDLVRATAQSLTALVATRAWMSPERTERVMRECCDRAHLTIAGDADPADAWEGARTLVTHLRQSGQLTTSFLLRAVLSGHQTLFEAALVELSGLPERKAVALARRVGGSGFALLFKSANLPLSLLPAFQAAAAAGASLPAGTSSARLSRATIARVLQACETFGANETGALLALLRRFDAEAAREEARAVADELRARPAPLLGNPDAFGPKASKPPRLIEIDLVRLEADLAA